ncbi:Kelch domain-containing protein 10 [Thelohanellus kitauei]|uniref:Kelch domain-containing protein 10 n=1 Tax=Thelohanellus kitauei TaxID=669202 RepID=A0A0C2MP68_THEKT|nr:Kelch domain-containing protein 10 [Thelohanellus kitauei]
MSEIENNLSRGEPQQFSKQSMLTIRDSLIIYGCIYDDVRGPVNEMWKIDTMRGICKKYQKPTSVEETCMESSICAVGGLVYIFGGVKYRPDDMGGVINNLDNHKSNSIIYFDTENGTWHNLSPNILLNDENTPPPMFDASMFHFNGSLYIFGGHGRGTFQRSMYRFCLTTFKWSRVQQDGEIPRTEIYSVDGTVFQNKYYFFRRAERDLEERFKRVTVFDLSTNLWKTNQYPCNRVGESIAFSEGQGFMTGGMNGAEYFDDVWKIDLKTLEWTKFDQKLKTCRFEHVTSIVGNHSLYLFGGIFADRFDVLEMYVYSPLSLYSTAMVSLIRSGRLECNYMGLPPSIQDEFNIFLHQI